MSKVLQVIPKVSEKALEKTSDKVYVFYVPLNSSKHQIKKAVEEQYGVKVKDIRSVVIKGKAKKSMRKRLQPLEGKRADQKKAYVSLLEGEIKVLEETA